MIFLAPASRAMSISSPVPMVDAAIASLFAAPPTSVSPDGAGHLDHRGAAVQPPLGPHRVAERSGDGRRAVGAAERLERAFAAVGDGQLDAVVAELPARRADGRGHLRAGGRALELVDRCEHAHRRSLGFDAHGNCQRSRLTRRHRAGRVGAHR